MTRSRTRWEPLGEESIGFLLVHSAQGWIRCLEQALRPLGLTHLQFALMAATALLVHQGETPHQGQLAAFTGFDRFMVSRSLGLLLKRRLLMRTKHPSVPRGHLISLTPHGRATLDAARPLYDKAMLDFFGSIDDKQLAAAAKTLRLLLEHTHRR